MRKYFIVRIANFFALFFLLIFLLFSIPYYHTEIFKFNEKKVFEGKHLYNPYKNVNGEYLKANFHAHSVLANGITNGAQSPVQVINAYLEKGYDIPCLSNYQSIDYSGAALYNNFLTAYEHGYNVKKTHQIVLNASEVCKLDFPLFQTKHHKQLILKKLKRTGGLVALAHPVFCNGYSESDLAKLQGYDFIEVLNNYRNSKNIWDAALSSGNPVWITAGDDTHDISKPHTVFRKWNMISANEGDVISALKKGASYGVDGKNGIDENILIRAQTDSCRIKLLFKNEADLIRLIRQNGEIVFETSKCKQVEYELKPNDQYVRAEIKTNNSTIYLNPFIRYNGESLASQSYIPQVNYFYTILFRIGLMGFDLMLLLLIRLIIVKGLRKRRPAIPKPTYALTT